MTQQEDIAIFNEKDQCFESIKLGFYRYYVKQFFLQSLGLRPALYARDPGNFYDPLDPADKPWERDVAIGRAPKINPCLFLTTSALLHRNNFKPVYQKLRQQLEKDPLAIAATKKAAQYAKEDGITVTPLPHLISLLCSPKFLIAAFFTIMQFSCLIPLYCWQLSRRNPSTSQKTRPRLRGDRLGPLFQRGRLIQKRHQLTSSFSMSLQRDLFFQQIIILLSKQGFLGRCIRSLIKIEQFDRVLHKYQPNVIYKNVARSHYDSRIARIAKKHCIPVSTGIVASITTRYRNFGIYPCDFITLLGETQKTILKKRGYSDKQLLCVGQPELDDIKKHWNSAIVSTYLSRIVPKFQHNIFTILIATSYIDLPHEKAWITAVCDYAKKRTFPLQILLKPHPSASGIYASFEHYSNLTILPSNTSLYPCLAASNLILTDVSHAGKLAIFFRKPLMVVNFSDKKYPFNHFDEENVAWLAKNPEELALIIEAVRSGKLVIDNSAYDFYIKQHLTSDDGKAAERIVSFLMGPRNTI